jgi:hypothetical protein
MVDHVVCGRAREERLERLEPDEPVEQTQSTSFSKFRKEFEFLSVVSPPHRSVSE